jgi:predicted transcriptional regulator YheO
LASYQTLLALVEVVLHGIEKTMNVSDFVNVSNRYYGEFTPENLVFDANLQHFSRQVGLICALENGGKISPQDAFNQISDLWETLERSAYNLL